jgi:hypothetical protein
LSITKSIINQLSNLKVVDDEDTCNREPDAKVDEAISKKPAGNHHPKRNRYDFLL